MPFNQNETQSFEYRRNECCHKILETLYRRLSPIRREGTIGSLAEGKGKITSNTLFASVETLDFVSTLHEPDNFILDCCEYLELNNHVDPLKTDTGIIQRVKFTKQGVDAYKSDYYLKENQKQDYAKQLRRSTLLNNWLTPLVAFATLIVSVVTLIIQRQETKDKQVAQEQIQQQLHSIDKMRQTEIDALYLLLTKVQKDVSYSDTTKTKAKQ